MKKIVAAAFLILALNATASTDCYITGRVTQDGAVVDSADLTVNITLDSSDCASNAVQQTFTTAVNNSYFNVTVSNLDVGYSATVYACFNITPTEVAGPVAMQCGRGGVASTDLNDSAVSSAKIADDAVNDLKVDWGSGVNQVDLDDVPDGSTYVRLTAVKDAYIDQDVSSTSSPTFTEVNTATVTASGDLTINANGGDLFIKDDDGQAALYVLSGSTSSDALLRLGDSGDNILWQILNDGNVNNEFIIANSTENTVFKIEQSGDMTLDPAGNIILSPSGALVPDVDALYNLGGSTASWNDAWLKQVRSSGDIVLNPTGLNVDVKVGSGTPSLSVYSDGSDKYIRLSHDDTDGKILTSSGGLILDPAGGDVTVDGKVTATGFDPPYLIDGVIYSTWLSESPSQMVQFSGRGWLVDGVAAVSWSGAERGSREWLFSNIVKNESINVFVQPLGNTRGVYVVNISTDGFTVIENQNGHSNVEFSYFVVGDSVMDDNSTQYSNQNLSFAIDPKERKVWKKKANMVPDFTTTSTSTITSTLTAVTTTMGGTGLA